MQQNARKLSSDLLQLIHQGTITAAMLSVREVQNSNN